MTIDFALIIILAAWVGINEYRLGKCEKELKALKEAK